MKDVCALILFLSTIAHAQNPAPIALASFGYTISEGVMYGAPGQLLVVSIYGIRTRIPAPICCTGVLQSIAGISVKLIQTDGSALPVSVEGLQQTTCPAQNVNCPVITSITLVLPPEMQLRAPPSAGLATMRIFENEDAVGDIPLHPVSDFVHVLTSCDQTLIFVGALLDANLAPGCHPVVQHVNRALVTSRNPATPGELLILSAYGLGATGPGVPFPAPVQSFNLTYDFLANAAPRRGSPGEVSPPAAIGAPAVGLYQVNFRVPALPNVAPPACDDAQVKSNLTVTLSGPLTMDGAQICLRP